MKTLTLVNTNSKYPYSVREAFSTLRTNFLFCGSEIKTVLITSCLENEGKTTISFELSRLLSISEKRVLFMDCDLRKSIFAAKYTDNHSKVKGLSEYLSSQAELDDIIYSSQYENLDLILAGSVPPNPVELLGSARFKELMLSMRDKYDYVILDTAPLGAVIDASVVSRVCDGAAIVVTANKVNSRLASEIKSQLEKSENCKVIGAILNCVPVRSNAYHNRYYNKYYRKYGRYYGYGHYSYSHHADKHDKDYKKVEPSVDNDPQN